MSDIIKTQRSLATKALYQSQHQFAHLYRLICREDWIQTALTAVLSHKGARTAGIDGMTKKAFDSTEFYCAFIRELQEELRTGTFKPVPVRRVYIPKASGKKRPLGISTIKDRVVQMLLKMVLEPIWESDFLNCSNGFRPGRRTLDCIALLDSYITIQHETLLKLVAKRVADRKILDLIARFLKAGVMEQGQYQRTEIGSPQGAVCSPLLANIYFHQLDRYWWEHYGNLHRKDKERRRMTHQGNCALIRYADDWLLLTNGSKAEAYRLRDEFQQFLADELKLELAVEKTHVTHVNEGFTFLGFTVRRYVSGHDRPKLLVTPSRTTQDRLKTKVKEMTARKRFRDMPLLKFTALNAVLRGWATYYRHCNAKETLKDLDFWVNQRLFTWLCKRHRLTATQIMAKYKLHQEGRRVNLGIQDGTTMRYLYRMSDQPITKYRSRKPQNPYLEEAWSTALEQHEAPLPAYIWLGNAQNNERERTVKAELKAERGAQCEQCGSVVSLDLHHIKARRYGGQTTKENVQLLCERCHVQTPSYGDHRRLQ